MPVILKEGDQPGLEESCLKKHTKAGMVAHICLPHTSEVEAGGLVVQS